MSRTTISAALLCALTLGAVSLLVGSGGRAQNVAHPAEASHPQVLVPAAVVDQVRRGDARHAVAAARVNQAVRLATSLGLVAPVAHAVPAAPVVAPVPAAGPAAAPAPGLAHQDVRVNPAAQTPAGRTHARLARAAAVKAAVPVGPAASVAVGNFPTGIAVSATQAWVANAKGNSVSVIDTTVSPKVVAATVPVGSFPIGVALNSAATQAYVANFSGSSLSVIDVATRTVTHTVTVGNHPDGVVESGGSVYVANLLSGTISVVDPVAGTVTATITLGGNAAPSGLAVSGKHLYADDARNGRTIVVDLGTNGVLGSVASGTRPAYISLAATTAYVASPGTNSVNLLDTAATPPTAGPTVTVGTAPYGVVAAPTSKLVLATNSGSNNVSVINTTTNTVIGSPVVLGTTPDAIALSPDGTTAYATNEGSNTVSVLHVNQPPVAGPVSFSGAVGNTVFGVGMTPATPSTTASGSVLSNSTDPEGDALTAVAGTFPTAHGGSVVVNSDGTFTYTSAAGFVGADTFTFTVSDGGPATSSSTATINVANRVWYVRNNDAGANDGRSISPFHTLAQAQTASSASDYIYVFKGDGTSTGQSSGIALKTGQHLIGQAQNLVVGTATLFTGNAANRPLITASSGAVVTLADGVTVAGLAANPSGTANGLSGGSGLTTGATINDMTVSDTGSGEGIILTNSTGTIAITSSSVTGGGDDAVVVTGSSGTLALTLTGDTLSEPDTVTGNDALNITTTGPAVVNPTISSTKFTAARGDLVQLNIGDASSSTLSFTNNTLSNNNANIVSGGGGFVITAGGGAAPAATLNFNIQNNTFRDALGNAVIIGNNSGTNAVKGTFSNNTVGVNGVVNSGSAQGGDLSVAGIAGGSIGITAEHNNFYEYNNAFGVNFQGTGTHSLDVKFDNNTIASPGNGASLGVGLQLNVATGSGSSNNVCFDAFANSLAGSGFNAGADIRLRQRNGATVRMPGFPSFAGQTAAQFTVAQNSPPTPTAITQGSFGGGGACTGL